MSYSKDQIYLSKIVPQIQENILNTLFGSEYVNAKTLLQTTSQINSSDSQDYEFEFRFVDENGHTSKQNWINFENEFDQSLTLQSYDDDVIYNYEPFVPLNNIHFRSYRKSNLYERKIMINMVVSRSESKNVLPLNIRLSKETVMSPVKHLNKYINIQRRQRCSYTFNDPKLANWKVDKTIRFFTENPNDKKLSIPLSIDNFTSLKYYDVLDIEFEYVGDFRDLYNSFFFLIEKIYKPYEEYNITYIIIKTIMNMEFKHDESLLSTIPTPTILTNNTLKTLNFQDYSFSFKLVGEHVIIAVFGDSSKDSSSFIIYSITESTLKHIHGNLHFLETKPKSQDKIINRLKSYMINYQNDQVPELSLFEAEYSQSNDTYALIDTIMFMSDNVEAQTYPVRQSYISKFLSSKDSFISQHFVENYTFDEEKTSWNYFINFVKNDSSMFMNDYKYITDIFKTDGIVCKSKNSSLFSSKLYKIKSKVATTIDFKLCYNHIKKLFYLYVIGDVEQVIKSKSLTNKHSIEHFGYSLLSPTSTKDVYILYVSPFMKNSFMFKPRLNWNTDGFSQDIIDKINSLMYQIYTNPLSFNNSTMKMAKAADGWVPISSKNSNPNTYLESIQIGSLIYDNLEEPITSSSLIRTKISSSVRKLMKSLYLLLNQYIIEKYFNKERFNSVLDIFDNDNINVNLLYNVGLVKRVFALNDNKYVLNSYVENAINKQFNGNSFITGIKLRTNDDLFDVNIIHSPLIREKIVDKLNNQYGYTPKSIDVIYFQRGLDEISSLIDIINLRILCENVLTPNGKIIFKLFDGDKIYDFLMNKEQTTNRRNQKKIDKTLGITIINESLPPIRETKDEYEVPTPESIKNVDSSIANDEFQYDNTEIEIYKQPRQSRLNVTTKSDSIDIKYSTDNITVQKPKQFSDINKLGLICYYYYKFNRFDSEGKFKSEKIITPIQTRNLSHILSINTELFGNIYDRQLENWYSIYHNVDKLFGSKDYTQNVLYDSINDGVLIEREYLNDDVLYFIKQRKSIKYSTAIVTKSEIDDIFKLSLPDSEYKLYVIFPNYITNSDIELLKNYLYDSFITSTNTEIFQYYTHPKINEDEFVNRLLFKKEFISFIFESFKLCDVCSPMTQTEIATFLSSNRKFSQIEYVENFFNSLTTFCVERA